MKRRHFLATGLGAVVAGAAADGMVIAGEPIRRTATPAGSDRAASLAPARHQALRQARDDERDPLVCLAGPVSADFRGAGSGEGRRREVVRRLVPATQDERPGPRRGRARCWSRPM